MFILRLRGRTRRMRVEQFIDSKEDNRRVHPCSDCYIVDLNLFHLNNLKPSSKFFTWFEVDSWNLVFFPPSGYHLGRSPVQTHGSQRGSVPWLAVGFRWLRWSQQVGLGVGSAGRVCEISVEILGLHITLPTGPTVSWKIWSGRFSFEMFWCFGS